MLPGKKNLYLIAVIFAVLATGVTWYIFSSQPEPVSEPGESRPADVSHRDGEAIARLHCTGCHQFPEPELLDKRTWQTQTLPAMGPHLGIYEFDGEEYPKDVTPGLPENFYPETSVIDSQEWKKILDYYETEAPERLEVTTQEQEIVQESRFFQPRRPSYRVDANPMASAVRSDPANKLIYLADATIEKLLVFNTDLEIISNFDIRSPISDIRLIGETGKPGRREIILTHIGSIAPSDAADGSVIRGWYNPETGEGNFDSLIIDDIRRPVESLPADLDGDGRDDLLISEFGHRRGSIFWLKAGDDGYEPDKNVLIDTPGCLQNHVMDYTKNGYPDVLALCSQTDQAIYLFENTGEGEFNRKTLMEFPVTAGSSSFELVDFNEDGNPDILYTSGDNADYSISYKPYHGVYIFLNDGNDNFEQEWFYPVNGAYSAKAHDFNGDGNLDLAVISFFADYAKKPEEGFIFFENRGDFTFTPYHPRPASYGRWIAMDINDWSGNGAGDIVLANFSRGPTKVLPQIEAVLTRSPHLLVLENLTD